MLQGDPNPELVLPDPDDRFKDCTLLQESETRSYWRHVPLEPNSLKITEPAA